MRHAVVLLSLLVAAYGYDNGAPYSKLPPLGWSSWVALGPVPEKPVIDFCNEEGVMQAIDAFVELGFPEYGYTHFHLDDCWSAPVRNESGHLFADPLLFPNGIEPIVEYAHSKGLVFGLYSDAGTRTCNGIAPGSKGHWQQDADSFASWNVDWVKMDWCNNDGADPREVYPHMSSALNATGRRIHFNLCEGGSEAPWEWGYDIAMSWRMGHDHVGQWANTLSIIEASAAIPAQYTGKPFGWNDMDMLQTGNGKQAAKANGHEANMTDVEYRTEFSMWAISASPLVVTTPLVRCEVTGCKPYLSDLQKEILFNKEVLAINQDVTPQGRPVVNATATTAAVWARTLSDSSVAVALFNPNDVPAAGNFTLSTLKLNSPTAAVRDLWAHADLPPMNASSVFRQTVPPHGTTVLRVHPN